MRLFHVSEEGTIRRFAPRIPIRDDLDRTTGLAWAIDEARLYNFLTPRNCPRVTCHTRDNTTREDRQRFFSSATARRPVVIEGRWLSAMRDTTVYLYELDPADFALQDAAAG